MKHHSIILFLLVSFIWTQAPEASAQKITVSGETGQILRFGIDAERLWHWRPNNGAKLAEVGVKELNAEFVRVAIDCAYEREEGVKKPDVYKPVLEMMTHMRNANPNIKFFATPRPLFNAYTKEETMATFGKDKAPWTPYPGWITGLKQYGTKKFDVKKLARYFADYLNLMHKHGFDIDYLDYTNEKQLATAADMIYLRKTIPTLLDKGVKVPLFIAPSSWDCLTGTKFLNALDPKNGGAAGFDIASTHNTGEKGSPEAFAEAARRLNKEVWTTEMHGWVGQSQPEDIKNSAVFLRHLRAGFSGFATWLFYGPQKLRPHPMVGSDNKGTIIRTAKYEIYKKVANTVNLGNYVPSASSESALMPAAMKKGDRMIVCVLNTSEKQVANATVELPAGHKFTSDVEVTFWDAGTPSAGTTSTLKPEGNSFTFNPPPNSFYSFIFKVSGGG